MSASLTIPIPFWLDFIFVLPILYYRLLRYGYTFRKIYLGDGESAILDLQDYYRLRGFKWFLSGNKTNLYASRTYKIGHKKVTIKSMHRDITNAPKGLVVDHINGNGLDNRRENLRLATHAQNMYNRPKIKSKTSSPFIGVYFDNRIPKWTAKIRFQGKRIYLGSFKSEIDAAKAYDAAALKYHGQFAKLNFSEKNSAESPVSGFLRNLQGARLNFPGPVKKSPSASAVINRIRRVATPHFCCLIFSFSSLYAFNNDCLKKPVRCTLHAERCISKRNSLPEGRFFCKLLSLQNVTKQTLNRKNSIKLIPGTKLWKGTGKMAEYSVSPTGEKHPIPEKEEYAHELKRVETLVNANRQDGKEIVVVMGVGFVGAVMAAIIADTVDKKTRKSGKFVIGCQRPSTRSYWKIPMLNEGLSPVKAEDPEVDPMIRRCVLEKKTLIATYNSDCLKFADCVVVDVQCDYSKKELGNMRTGSVEMAALEATMKTIADRVPANCLTLIETTVAPGTTEFIAWPIMKKAFEARGIKTEPLLSHSFERVMPGRNYVSSIRDFWRVCSGCNAEARSRVEKFLREVLNTEEFPLTVMDRPIESETTKIVENSFRATTLAFLDEWSLFAERNGVDLIKVVKAIKMRPTHNNMIFPGPGIGGYCLPKDGGLGYWAYKHILGFEDDIFKMSTVAIDINDTRGLHVAELTRDALRNMGTQTAGAKVLLCGASYRQDVGDTRYSGSEIVVRKLTEMGADISVHDPYVCHWYELEQQNSYPEPGRSWSRFFRNQEDLVNIRVQNDLPKALKGVAAVIFAIPHKQYLKLEPEKVVEWTGTPLAVIDCFGILTDEQIQTYFKLGCEVKGLGRGHIQRIKDQTRKAKS
jgi:UDP-N-acetyl-D-glucosamine dehydrogenase